MVADPAVLSRIERGVTVARELVIRRAGEPARYVRWLPLQCRFMLSPALVRLLRAGNQGLGKTTAGLAEVVGRCTGRHPLGVPVPPPPVEWWILCASRAQSVAIQRKLYALLPRDEIRWGKGATRYSSTAGFSPLKDPVVLFRNGSIIRIKTTSQDGLDLAGATIDGALFDEPPAQERLFTEILQRVEERGGLVLICMTPVNADVGYLRDLVAAGAIEDHHSRLTPESLIPVGRSRPLRTADGRLKDAAWIESREAKVSAYERDVVVHGEWEFRALGAYFDGAWDPGRLVYRASIAPTDKLILGIDHGDRPGKQVAVLLAVDDRGEDPVVHLVDLYRDVKGLASPKDDARGILAMLAHHGVTWDRLRFAGGDRVHLPRSGRQKSNRDLAYQLAKLLGVRELSPPIYTIKRGPGRGAGSLSIGSRWLFHAMVAGRFSVSPEVEFALEAIPRYTLDDDDKGYKDVVDAVRYGLDRYIFAKMRPMGRQDLRVV